LVLLLDGVGNPHNLGALLRTAAHFDVAAVLLTPGSAELSGAVYRTAEGGAEAQPLIVLDSLSNLAELSAQGFSLVCAEMQGGSSSFAPGALPDRCVLILGAEPTGVSTALRTVADSSISIPGSGKVESLNVAAAGAILLAAWHR
jgi:tRNA G18 (ribose-2'-O)-methylase SpoU